MSYNLRKMALDPEFQELLVQLHAADNDVRAATVADSQRRSILPRSV